MKGLRRGGEKPRGRSVMETAVSVDRVSNGSVMRNFIGETQRRGD